MNGSGEPLQEKKIIRDYYIFRDEPEDQIPTNWQSKSAVLHGSMYHH